LLRVSGQDSKDLWQIEGAHIEKIAKFTAEEHAAILFEIYDQVGYASEGTARKLDLPPVNSHCLLSPALSHSGRYLAYLNGDQSESCELLVLELATGKVRKLAGFACQPRDLSWSWDDSEIAFTDPRISSPSIQVVSFRDGAVRVLVPPHQLKVNPTASGVIFRFDSSFPLEWSRSGRELLASFSRDVPTKQPNVYSSHPFEVRIQLTKGNALAELGEGYGAASSPVADRIAWYQDSKIVVANIDGSGQEVLAGAPRWLGIFPGDFKGPLVWGPDGNRLFFGTFESETCRDGVYPPRADTRHAKRFLGGTCIVILDWRSAGPGHR
jgi:dipeptidyl aminopeptidase/acylaminoacyl peptidase